MTKINIWYPHYIRDFKAKTGHLSLAARGAYRALIDEYWERQGPLPADERLLCRMIGAFPDEWAEISDDVLAFFVVDNSVDSPVYRHVRIDSEIKKAKEQRDAKAERIAKARQAKALKALENAKNSTEKPPTPVNGTVDRDVDSEITELNTELNTGLKTGLPTPTPTPLPTEVPFISVSPDGDQKNQAGENSVTDVSRETIPDTEKLKPDKPPKPPPKSKRGTRLPDDWEPTTEFIDYALNKGWSPEATNAEVENFRDYWIAKTGKDATKRCWFATWRSWIRNDLAKRGPGDASPDAPSYAGGRAGEPAGPSAIAERRIAARG